MPLRGQCAIVACLLSICGAITYAEEDEGLTKCREDIASVNTDVRAAALASLAQLSPSPERRRMLMSLASDPEARIRSVSLSVLRHSHGPDVVSKFVSAAVDDPSRDVRRVAMEYLVEDIRREDVASVRTATIEAALLATSVESEQYWLVQVIEAHLELGASYAPGTLLHVAAEATAPGLRERAIWVAKKAAQLAPITMREVATIDELMKTSGLASEIRAILNQLRADGVRGRSR